MQLKSIFLMVSLGLAGMVQAQTAATNTRLVKDATGTVASSTTVAPSATAPATASTGNTVNPFTGRPQSLEVNKTMVDQMKDQNTYQQELIKYYKDRIELKRLMKENQEVDSGKSSSSVGTPGIPGTTPKVEKKVSTPDGLGTQKELTKKVSTTKRSTKKVAKVKNEPVKTDNSLVFSPPMQGGVMTPQYQEPKLTGIIAVGDRKIAVVNNGVRIVEGDSVGGQLVSKIEDNHIYWGNKRIHVARDTPPTFAKTDYEMPGTGQSPQVAQSLKAQSDNRAAKQAYKAGLPVVIAGQNAQGGVGGASVGYAPPYPTQGSVSPGNSNTLGRSMPPPPPNTTSNTSGLR